MSAPDADELAVRARLRRLFNEPALPDPADSDDWWDRLYTDNEPERRSADPHPALPTPARSQPTERGSGPRQSLLDAWDNIRPRTRWLIYHGTAAAFGWGLGIVTWATHVTAWIAADRWANPQSITCYLLGLGTVSLYRRTRHWWWPVAWMTAIPVSAITLGVLLYAPNA